MNEIVNGYLQSLTQEVIFNEDIVTKKMRKCCRQIAGCAFQIAEDEQEEVEDALIALGKRSNWQPAIAIFSMAFSIRHSEKVMHTFLEYLLQQKDHINAAALYFVYGQCSGKVFLYHGLQTYENKVLLWKILEAVLDKYERCVRDYLVPIQKEERNPQFVIVLTEQLLAFAHGPTKSALDRCKILIEKMGKKVLLLNTAETSCAENAEFYEAFLGNYIDEYTGLEYVDWKGCRIPYFQCENDMPNLETVKILLGVIRSNMPGYILTIGGGGIVGALASRIIPTLSIGMVPSSLSVTGARFQTIGRKLEEEDLRFLKDVGRVEEDVIFGQFGSSILERMKSLTREEVNFPKDGFLIALVGGRLDQELTETFWEIAEKALSPDIYFIVMGNYSDKLVEKVTKNHPVMDGHIIYAGYLDNVLSYMELCDLYLNPERRGGGTSCVEAMSVGLPVVTVNYGDVAVNAGEEFFAESMEAIPELIGRYRTDNDFYHEKSEAAKVRAEFLLSQDEEFERIVKEFLKRADG